MRKAREMISTDGPSEFSLNQLARELAVNPATLYWYFPSKEAVVGEVQREVFGEFGEELRVRRDGWVAEGAERGCPPSEGALYVLLRFAEYYLGLDRNRPEYARMIAFSLDPRIWLDDEQGRLLGPLLVRVFQQVAIAFVSAAAQGALSEDNGAARAVQYWAALQGMAQTAKLARLAPGLFDPLELGMQSARTLLTGWGACPETLARAAQRLSP